jgi:hypothetical protein
LNHLLKIVAPFDPLKYVVNWDRQKKRHPGDEPVSIRTHLDYMARANGYRQFEDVIDESRIHSLLSDIFFEMGAATSGVQHLLATIKSLPPDYFDENPGRA